MGEGKQYRRKQFHLPVSEIDWNFPQERHDVSERHVKKAEELLTVKKRRPTRRTTYVRSVKPTAEEKKEEEGMHKAKNLWNKLSKTVKAPRLKNTLIKAFGTNFTVKHGVNKSPSRNGKKSSISGDFNNDLTLDRRTILNQIKNSGAKSEISGARTATGGGRTGTTTDGFKVSDFGDFFEEQSPFEQIKKTGKVPDVADAFTVRSVHLGVLDGVYDFEQMKQLTKIGKYQERREAYARAYPVVIPSQLEKMAELRMQEPELELTLPEFAKGSVLLDDPGKTKGVSGPSGLPDLSHLAERRPKTTGGVREGGSAGRQNWRGYKNLVGEFERSTKVGVGCGGVGWGSAETTIPLCIWISPYLLCRLLYILSPLTVPTPEPSQSANNASRNQLVKQTEDGKILPTGYGPAEGAAAGQEGNNDGDEHRVGRQVGGRYE